jgi:hypothetical protein
MTALLLLLALILFAIAGTADYDDRVHGLGASMVPCAEWTEAFND